MPPDTPLPSPSSEDRLRRLVDAGIQISAQQGLEGVLNTIVVAGRDVTGAGYAALGVLDVTGTEIERFVTSGIPADTIPRIGPFPTGKGILGVLIADPRPLRLRDLATHPKAHGFPANHPPMHSFLGVPIVGRHGVIGNLYFTEKVGAAEFSDEDEAIAIMLAAQAAVAVENATLHDNAQRMIHEIKSMQVSRDRFFAMINHELRNALTAVYGWADLLIRKAGPDSPRAAREVYESAERTLALLNDLLDLSRIESERLRPSIREADVTRLIRDAVVALEPAAAERRVELVLDGPTDSAACRTDPQRVGQILINLLSNAIRHTPKGGAVRIKAVLDEAGVRFDVADRGPGIPASEQERIFEPFAGNTSSEERGTGLGLTLSKQLALMLGGDLTVESVPGAGSTFTLSIPRRFGQP